MQYMKFVVPSQYMIHQMDLLYIVNLELPVCTETVTATCCHIKTLLATSKLGHPHSRLAS